MRKLRKSTYLYSTYLTIIYWERNSQNDVSCLLLTPINERQHDVKSHFGVVIDVN